ncbi:hypothetical protein STSP2_02490 [Anaerohalosphaera lusitana]|uniref:Uncharacterized protein n=1 Tax=Anaerohalosphaera lusitana TaxID=1936003 RepID=A0A1U9NN11_9BACT|nr:hypothetical protein [Anaerohalosphaera lusitana]AQT69301.1 hypothetical protein STSP2_02490 [Anaerohalosphaera lusitana]
MKNKTFITLLIASLILNVALPFTIHAVGVYYRNLNFNTLNTCEVSGARLAKVLLDRIEFHTSTRQTANHVLAEKGDEK